jgi:hypothetical protein
MKLYTTLSNLLISLINCKNIKRSTKKKIKNQKNQQKINITVL